jgi:hypothetical protein
MWRLVQTIRGGKEISEHLSNWMQKLRLILRSIGMLYFVLILQRFFPGLGSSLALSLAKWNVSSVPYSYPQFFIAHSMAVYRVYLLISFTEMAVSEAIPISYLVVPLTTSLFLSVFSLLHTSYQLDPSSTFFTEIAVLEAVTVSC